LIRDAPNINHFWAGLIVDELVRNGIRMFCLAPGSRSTPLTTAVARHPDTQHVTHVDERGTAFFATGYARSTGQPAVWITTSGTAVANGLPAVVEAATDHLPLILLTADRPPELRSTGANQTIDQVKIFGDYVKEFFDLPTPDPSLDPALPLTTVDQMVHQTRTQPAGPVHLNCMFRKPLAPDTEAYRSPPEKEQLRGWYTHNRTYTSYASPVDRAPPSVVNKVAHVLANGRPGLIIAGRLTTRKQGRAIADLSEKLNWPLLPDVGSHLRLTAAGATAIPYFDLLLTTPDFPSTHQPNTVLHFGARTTSKRLRTFVSRAAPDHHIVVKNTPERFDIHHDVSVSIEADIESFARHLTAAADPHPRDDWLHSWRGASETIGTVLDAYTEQSNDLREPRVARLLSQNIPPNHGLFLASSRPIRDLDSYAQAQAPETHVGANRGASGIDGTITSAAGFARGLQGPVTLLIGDLALLHDLNALAVVRDSPQPVIIVAINNNGGGIFSFLPIANHKDVFEDFFATPFDVALEPAAEMFDLSYARPTTTDAFISTYRQTVENGQSAIIELETDRDTNVDEHRQIERAIAEAVSTR
jgi:2-succinyl-5-enolpyruvyl-6-hydroxy-3-cyclohexene-1-carboxylate synthase